jgi:hypothetical protein
VSCSDDEGQRKLVPRELQHIHVVRDPFAWRKESIKQPRPIVWIKQYLENGLAQVWVYQIMLLILLLQFIQTLTFFDLRVESSRHHYTIPTEPADSCL